MVGRLSANWGPAGGDVVGLTPDETLVEQGVSVRDLVSSRCAGRTSKAVYFRLDRGSSRGRAATSNQNERQSIERWDAAANKNCPA